MGSKTWSYNGYFGTSRDITLVPGELNADARDVFCRGHCHSLALALMRLLPDAEPMGVWIDGEADHVCVRLPDGSLLDADGVTSDDAMIEAYNADVIDWLDEETLDAMQETGFYRRARPDDALPFARALIEREGIDSLAMAA